MIISLLGILRNNSRFFQQVLLDLGTLDHATVVKVDVNVLAEPGRVVITDGFGVTERFQNGVRLENLLLDPRVLPTDRRQVLQDQLCTLGLARAGLTGDDDALVLAIATHVRVRVVPDGEDVRRKLADLALLVQLDLVCGVDGQDLVRVDRDQDRSGVGLKMGKKTL